MMMRKNRQELNIVLCPKCGRENNDQAKVCFRCYTPLRMRGRQVGEKTVSPAGPVAPGVCSRERQGLLNYFVIFFNALGKRSRGKNQEVEKNLEEPAKRREETSYGITLASQGTWIAIGGLSYSISTFEWTDRVSERKFPDKKTNASFLVIHLTVRNDDKTPRTIPFFGLVNDEKAEYDVWDKGWFIENRIGKFERINPGVAKSGIVVFDVPRRHPLLSENSKRSVVS